MQDKQIEDAFGQMAVADGTLHALLVMRERSKPHDPPTPMEIDSLSALDALINASPFNVHFLYLFIDDEKVMLKVSFNPKSASMKYIVHTGTKNVAGNELTAGLFEQLKANFNPNLWNEVKQNFLQG